MEAVSYIKLTLDNSTIGTISFVEMNNYLNKLGWEGSVKKFYAQKFYQEMILKYFDGWDEVKHDVFIKTCFLENKLNDYEEIRYFKDARYKLSIKGTNSIEIISFKPETLDNFISDCERVGIELFWKENININKKRASK